MVSIIVTVVTVMLTHKDKTQIPTLNLKLVKRSKSRILAVTLTFVASSFFHMSALDTLPDAKSLKVGKTEKSEPAVSGIKLRI